ncbi:biotin/lipoyl-containing protein [Zoogloea ramigera]|uniref:biotin/lipoyl-containing protein n=1 Tax=Zoogloea ramigera TaxID=350 RepID=UPI003FA2D1F4
MESDKASMEFPSRHAGTVKVLKVKVGGKVSQGSVVRWLQGVGAAAQKRKSGAALLPPPPPGRGFCVGGRAAEVSPRRRTCGMSRGNVRPGTWPRS